MDTILTHLNDDGIMTVNLNRPDKLNALNNTVLQELAEVFQKSKTDRNVKALLLTGEGKAFCAGADISRLAECDATSGYDFAVEGQKVFRLLETLGKPSLSAINGYAFGGGCELAIASTIRIASSTAQFGQPEVNLGVIPGYGGTQRLARLIGKGRAMDLCLSGRFIDAECALKWGLVTDVVEPAKLLEKAHTILKNIVSLAPLAIQSIMDCINHGYDLSLSDALHLEAVHFAKTCATEDKKEGVSAFLEKRNAQFKGE